MSMSKEDLTWLLSPHGKSKNVAQWVVDTFGDRVDSVVVQNWVNASQQILDTDERLGLSETHRS
jgi:hypothetical protein